MVKEVWAKQHKGTEKHCGFKHESLCRHWAPVTQRWLLVLLVIISNFPSIDFLSWATKEELPFSLLYLSTAVAPFFSFFTSILLVLASLWDEASAVVRSLLKLWMFLFASLSLSLTPSVSPSLSLSFTPPSPFCCFLTATPTEGFLHLSIPLLSPPRGRHHSI